MVMPFDADGNPSYTNHPRRCIPCLSSVARKQRKHEGCWGDQQVPGHLMDMFWCECPCNCDIQSLRDRFLEKDVQSFPNKDH